MSTLLATPLPWLIRTFVQQYGRRKAFLLADLTIVIVYPNAIYKRQQFVIKIELIAEMFSLIRIGTPSCIASVALRIVIFIGFRIYKGDTNITRLPFILRNTFLSFLKCRFQPSSSLARHFIIGDGSCFHPFVHFKAYDYQLFLFLFTYILYNNFLIKSTNHLIRYQNHLIS